MSTTNSSKRSWLRRAALIICVIAVGGIALFGCLWVGLSIAWEHWESIFLWITSAVASLAFIGSIVAAWKYWNVTSTCKWELGGGIILIVLGFLPTVGLSHI